MKLLIGYDGSECSDLAVAELAFDGLPESAEARVLCVAERWLPPPGAVTLAAPGENVEPGLERASALAAEARERVAKLFPRWEVSAVAQRGSPAATILEYAESFRPDLVVLGSRGRSGLAHLLLGSVSEKVATQAPSSVHIARGDRTEARPPRLMIGLDTSDESQEAVRVVRARRWPKGTEAMIFTAIDRSIEDSPRMQSELGWIEVFQRNAEAELRGAGLVTTRLAVEGDPRRLIPDRATDWGADIVFVGSHGYGRVKRLLLGSVARAVAARADCSVEIVRTYEPLR